MFLFSDLSGRPAWRRLLRLVALAWLAVVTAAGAETEPSMAWRGHGGMAAQWWADASGQATFDAARRAFEAGQGRPADETQILPLGHGAAVWYRVQLPPASVPTRAVLALPYAGVDLVELFRPHPAGGWEVRRAGDSLPVAEWALPYLHPAFPMTVRPQESRPTYLRVQHSHPVSLQWELWDASGFNESSKLWHLALGAGTGLIVLVILLNLVHAVAWRDPIHLYYAVHVVLVGLSVMSLTGVAGEYLWPHWPWWNDIASLVVPMAALGWMGVLVRELVAERGKPLLSRLLLAHAAISLLIVAAFLVWGRHFMFRPFNVYALFTLAFILGVLAWYTLRRPAVGGWVLAGFAMLVAGSLFPLLRNLGLLPVGFATQYGPQIGGVLEIPLVLVGLYFRSRERRDNQLRAQALAHTDPLTGLANHRVLHERVELLLRRARRDPTVGGVLRVHVANYSTIRNEYGREAAEAALVRAAECVATEAAESDLVAREQGGDLVLVLHGRVERAQVSEAGRNIIARGLKFSGRLPPGVTLSLRVVGIHAPLPAGTAATLLATLAQASDQLGRDLLRRSLLVIDPAAGRQR
ncbi:diguanylate cyclase [Ramlibacter sp. RBP-2]|uniref:Diguanylate cyclase n=1 Tax=Ramlibacter lithotrophicus TaxID=2606681 RepID=A0A7X6DE96_9BURK|nr:7TM diverse intracellular signaling domain-containing protein [Ramlibacter lithotrophicus]NKE65577.1 diguanylate cyclase [Ramlibacter lithotrophicus]